jgi:hypothetical protein
MPRQPGATNSHEYEHMTPWMLTELLAALGMTSAGIPPVLHAAEPFHDSWYSTAYTPHIATSRRPLRQGANFPGI